MKILLLGGTRFLGRHLAEQAIAAGHDLTLLHRGQSGPALFPQARHLIADRNGELAVLDDGSTWDVAIDTNAYVPRHVRSVAARLAGRVGRYHLVSTISVYGEFGSEGPTEDSPLAALATLADPTTEAVTGETYGGLKVLCEQAAMAAFGEGCLVSRPGLLVGPHDPTGRFTWWVERLARGGTVLAPAPADAPVQFIDARDAAAWHLRQAEQGGTGVFNLTGPVRDADSPLTMAAFLDIAREALGTAAEFVWADEDFLVAQGVAPWSDLPVWVPRSGAAMHRTDITRAVRAGLQCRPLAQTVVDTLAWVRQGGAVAAPGGPARPAVGLSAEREAAVRAAWAAHLSAAG